jgi:hypothetical protein
VWWFYCHDFLAWTSFKSAPLASNRRYVRDILGKGDFLDPSTSSTCCRVFLISKLWTLDCDAMLSRRWTWMLHRNAASIFRISVSRVRNQLGYVSRLEGRLLLRSVGGKGRQNLVQANSRSSPFAGHSISRTTHFHLEDGGSMFLWNTGIHIQKYMSESVSFPLP